MHIPRKTAAHGFSWNLPRLILAGLAGVVLLVIGGCGWFFYSLPEEPSALHERLRERFPRVPTLTIGELRELMENDRPVVLLDRRAPEEFAVSHLRGAVRVDGVEQAREVIADAPDHAVAVVYCSLGYRSAKLAQDLREQGIESPVYNLKGSLFAWANRGLPVYREGRETRGVHPNNRFWGRWLEPHLWRYEPAQPAEEELMVPEQTAGGSTGED